MERTYNDMYALFRHDRGAEAYFNTLPSFVQDAISARYKTVDSLDRLRAYAARLQHTGGPETGEPGGTILPSPGTF